MFRNLARNVCFFRISLRRATNSAKFIYKQTFFCLFQTLPAISLSLTRRASSQYRFTSEQRARPITVGSIFNRFPSKLSRLHLAVQKIGESSERKSLLEGRKIRPRKFCARSRSVTKTIPNVPRRVPCPCRRRRQIPWPGLLANQNPRGNLWALFRIYQPNFRTNDQNRNQSRRFQVRRKKKRRTKSGFVTSEKNLTKLLERENQKTRKTKTNRIVSALTTIGRASERASQLLNTLRKVEPTLKSDVIALVPKSANQSEENNWLQRTRRRRLRQPRSSDNKSCESVQLHLAQIRV